MEFITEGEIKMNKKDLVQNIIMSNPTLTKKSVDEIVNSVFDNMVEALSKGETVVFLDLVNLKSLNVENVMESILQQRKESESKHLKMLNSDLQNH